MEEAKEVIERVSNFFKLKLTPVEVSELSDTFTFHANRLPPDQASDLEALIYIECHEEAPSQALTVGLLKRIIGRVQRRLWREHKPSKTALGPVPDHRTPMSEDAIVSTVKEYLMGLSATDAVLFELRFFRDVTVTDIAEQTGMGKTAVYDRLANLRIGFSEFIEN